MPKILFCGKGGSGKSTLLSLVALCLAESENVLVLDADESNPGLARMLGLASPQMTLMAYLGGKAEFRKSMGRKGDLQPKPLIASEDLSFETLPNPCVSGRGRLKLVSVGKVEEAHEGCACPMGVLARDILQRFRAEPGLFILIDTEAGLEHFGRGLLGGVDQLVAVADPSYDGLMLVSTIHAMAKEERKALAIVLNRVDAETEPVMRAELGKRGMRSVSVIPSSFDLVKANLQGLPVPLSAVRDRIDALLTHLSR